MKTIAMIGLGNMGSGMCANLVRAGYEVLAFDLSSESVARATENGARGGGKYRRSCLAIRSHCNDAANWKARS